MSGGGPEGAEISAARDTLPPGSEPDADASQPHIDSGLQCFVMLAAFFQKSANAEQILHARGKSGTPFDDTDILITAKELGLKARAAQSTWDRLGDAVRLPVLARRKDGSYLILAKMKEDRSEILVHDPLVGRPEPKSRAAIEEVWDGSLILITSRAALTGNDRRFDVSWFIPAIVKYRRMFSEVLIASAFIQVLGLISPLFFMVI
ncbi:MAG: apxIB 1, partial [Rhodospirillales bacterium]|nr:apxIB 1 [Rhodospirillales bacterium]